MITIDYIEGYDNDSIYEFKRKVEKEINTQEQECDRIFVSIDFCFSNIKNEAHKAFIVYREED